MKILGIDFGTWSIKAVEMESNWRKVEILDFHEVKMPLQLSEPVPMYQSALAQLLGTLPSHPDKIVTSLSSDKVALRFLRVPLASRKKVEQMYQFELEDGIPFRLDESITEHRITPDGRASLVFAAVAPKKFVKSQIEWYQSVGVDPDWLCFDGMGAINLFLSKPPQKELNPNESILICDIGHSKTHLSVLEGTNLAFFRTCSWGSFKITEILAETWAQALEDAEYTKHTKLDLTAGDFGGVGSESGEGITQLLKQLVNDLTYTKASYRNLTKRDITTLYLMGGGSELRGLDAFLGEALGMSVQKFSGFSTVSLKPDLAAKTALRFCESWGRAQVFTRKSPFLFNFRKKELGKHTSLDDVESVLKNPHLNKLLQFAAVLALVLFAHVTISKALAKRQLKTSEEFLSKVFQDTFRSVPTKVRNNLIGEPKDLKKFVDQKVKELDQKLELVSKDRVSMGTLFKKVSVSFPAEIKVDVNTLEINERSLLLKGVLYQGDLNQVVESLKSTSYFSELETKNENGQFEIRGKVVVR